MTKELTLFLFAFAAISCSSQNIDPKKNSKLEIMECDTVSGSCEIPVEEPIQGDIQSQVDSKLKLIYFTDPICSFCWGIEPQLRKLELEYGDQIEIEYHMGGLLKDWSYNAGGISKPSDVAHHWEEVSDYVKMPIDGNIWIEDPLSSSYPPSIAFKAAQIQDPQKALTMLRTLREMVFLRKINISKWENIELAALKAGLNPERLKTDFDNEAALSFQEDLNLAHNMGVRGFPSIYFLNENAEQLLLNGFKPYADFQNYIKILAPEIESIKYEKDPLALLQHFGTMTARELAYLMDNSEEEALLELEKLVSSGKASKTLTSKASIFEIKDP